MRRVSYFPYISLIVFLFAIMSIPNNKTESLKSGFIGTVSPFWKKFHLCRNYLLNIPTYSNSKNSNFLKSKEFHRMSLENELLKGQSEGFYQWLFFEQRIEEQSERLQSLEEDKMSDNDFILRRAQEIKGILKSELQAIPAKIIYREPISWSSSIWINVGEKNNQKLQKVIVKKDSPVVLGNSLVGIVEYVGKTKSRVRLITDSGLVPSVRVVRGPMQDRALYRLIKNLSELLHTKETLFETAKEKKEMMSHLENLMNRLSAANDDKYLAKGELSGSNQPLWRSKNQILKGIGFNYDYADGEGPSRDLRTGKVMVESGEKHEASPIIQLGDLLVTTGMDGIFPAGLHVATVSKIKDLDKGDYSYEIEAKPTALNMNELEIVFVIPPLCDE